MAVAVAQLPWCDAGWKSSICLTPEANNSPPPLFSIFSKFFSIYSIFYLSPEANNSPPPQSIFLFFSLLFFFILFSHTRSQKLSPSSTIFFSFCPAFFLNFFSSHKLEANNSPPPLLLSFHLEKLGPADVDTLYIASYIIFVIFSPRTKFWAQFFPHRKCVNRIKTVFRQNSVNFKKWILQENSANGKKAKIYTHIVCSKKKI